MPDTGVPFGNYQYEVYLAGMADRPPDLPVDLHALQKRARQVLDLGAYGYVAGGAGSEDTVRENREAFRRWRIVPRMLRDMGERDLRRTVLDTDLPAPVMLAPIGVQSILHRDAELAVARAAAGIGLPLVLSTAASRSLEEVADALGDTPRWFQLYWPNEPELAASFLRRAEAAGYGAIVVTLDNSLLAWRPRDIQGAYLPFLRGEGMANYLSDPVFRASLPVPPEEDLTAAIQRWVTVVPNPTLTWDDLSFLREHTNLPVLLKGILHPDDARQAVERGMDGVVVSNHGGRQVDGAVASLDALPDVVDAVPEDFPVLLDSGVRTGADVLKAIALGARAVLYGRPYAWGLAVAGEPGVTQVLRSLLADFDLTVGLTGHTAIDQIGPGALRRVTTR